MSGVDEGHQAIGLIPHNTPIKRDRGIFIMEYYMTDERIAEYLKALENEERAAATVEKYRRALLSFAAFLSGAAVTPEMIRLWKDDLRARNYVPSTINTYLAALNGFFRFCGWADCRARFLKIQRRLFRDSKRELTRAEYERLVAAAEAAGDRGLALLMETICSTGIRVSEVQYITVEAAKNGKTEIALIYSQLKRMQRSSCLRQRTLKWVQRHKLTVRFPPVNSIIYIWNHNFPCLCRKIVLYFATSKGSVKIVSLPLHIRNIDSVLKISYFGKTAERRRRKARWV